LVSFFDFVLRATDAPALRWHPLSWRATIGHRMVGNGRERNQRRTSHGGVQSPSRHSTKTSNGRQRKGAPRTQSASTNRSRRGFDMPAPPSVRQKRASGSRRGREHAERCAVGVSQNRCSACPWDVHRWYENITSVLRGLSRSLIDILGLEIAHPMALGAA